MLLHVFEAFHVWNLQPDWTCVPALPACAVSFLQHFPVWDKRAAPEACQIFVDGSWCPRARGAAWAIAVLVQVEQCWCWAGFFSNSAGAPACHDPLKVLCRSAHGAEVYANVYALAVAVANRLPTLISFDCTSAAGIAQGAMQPTRPCVLSRTAVALFHLAARLDVHVAFVHVRSHQGHPLNEFVDSAAKAVVAMPAQAYPPDSRNFAEAVDSGDLFWLWLAIPKGADLPELQPSGAVHDDVPLVPMDAGQSFSPLDFAPQRHFATSDSHHWGLRLVTYNCLSLQSPLQREMPDRQFSHHKVDVVFLQEARAGSQTLMLRQLQRADTFVS